MVDFELYRLFVRVSDKKNITKASQTLHVSQPALTSRIKNLEDILNVKLFDRSKSGMSLTNDGLRLYNKVKDSVMILESAEKMFRNKEVLNIATRVAIFSRLFGKSTSKFIQAYPEIGLNVQYLSPEEMMSQLSEQKVDVALYRKCGEINNPKIKFIKIGEVDDIFFANSNYYEEIKHTFTKQDLKKEILYLSSPNSIRSQVVIKELGYSSEELKNIKYIRNSTMLEMLKVEKGVGAISKQFIQKEIDEGIFKVLDTDFKLPKVDFGIYYNTDAKSKELDSYIKLVKADFSIT